MFCKYCGSELPNGTTFCLKCGKDDISEASSEIETTQEIKNSNSFEYTPDVTKEEVVDPQRNSMASKILTFAIMGLAFGASYYLSFLGLIFSIISRVKLSKYIKIYNDTEGKATVGKHLGLVGLIVSIVLLATLFLDIITFILHNNVYIENIFEFFKFFGIDLSI